MTALVACQQMERARLTKLYKAANSYAWQSCTLERVSPLSGKILVIGRFKKLLLSIDNICLSRDKAGRGGGIAVVVLLERIRAHNL